MPTDTEARTFQTDRLSDLIPYVLQEGMLTKTEAMDLIEALNLAREQLRAVEESGCAKSHVASWKRHIEPLVQTCQNEPPGEMLRDRARQVLYAANQVLSGQLSQILSDARTAKAAS